MTEDIHSFRIDIPAADLGYLHDRLAHGRRPEAVPGAGRDRGIPADELRELADHWRTGFDWRAQERRHNAYPQFVTGIDGQRVHFLHVRGDRPDARPLLLTHGYRSSVAEFLEVIDALRADFHLVVPSLPGYAFATPLSGSGWTMARSARACAELMRRFGYDRYGVHGGDIGAGVSGAVAGLDGDHATGVHLVPHPMTAAATATLLPGMAYRLDPDDPLDRLIRARMDAFRNAYSGYLAIQNTRPQTIGYGLSDSPLLQLAWVAEKLHEWTDRPVDRDLVLTHGQPVLVHRHRGERTRAALPGAGGCRATRPRSWTVRVRIAPRARNTSTPG